MHHQKKTLLLAAAVLVVLSALLLWLLSQSKTARSAVAVGFTYGRGQYPFPPKPAVFIAHSIVVAWVTNVDRKGIILGDALVRFKTAADHVIIDMPAGRWYLLRPSGFLSPGNTACLAEGLDADAKGVKFAFSYHLQVGTVLTAVSRLVRRLPLNLLPQSIREWLRRYGMIDGNSYHHYESPWIANPHGAANGSQPPHVATNRTSSTDLSNKDNESLEK